LARSAGYVLLERVVKDESNPTAEELSAWAFEAGAMWPTEDWDLEVTRDERGAVILRLAVDPSCPSRNFFLRCLYRQGATR